MLEKDKILFCTAKEFFGGYPFKVIKIVGSLLGETYVQKFHYHDYMQIWYVKNGQCIHYFNDVEYKLSKGDIFILPPYVSHKIIAENTENMELIGCEFVEKFIANPNGEKDNFDFNYLKPFIVDTEKIKPIFSLDGSAVKEIEKLLEEIVWEYEHKEMFFEMYTKANILKILSIIARQYSKTVDITQSNLINKYKDTIAKIILYMHEHCKDRIYIDDMCKMANMTPSYFSYVFKTVTGRTFTEYFNSLKISKAKVMLLQYNKKISEIAEEIGISDQAYFCRLFKKETGMSPGKYRKFS